MTMTQECPNCKVTLRLPETGVGRCPKCKTVVRAQVEETPATPSHAEELMPIIPEIGLDDEVGRPAETAFAPTPVAPLLPDYEPDLPPPLPRRSRRPRDRGPLIDIANPRPPASRVLPVTLLTLSFVVSLILVIGSFIYLIAKAREHRPAPPVVFPRR